MFLYISMAQYSTHLHFSQGLGVICFVVGYIGFRMDLEISLLGAMITVIAALAANLDSHASPSSRDLISVISTIPSFILISCLADWQYTPVYRVVLIGSGFYASIRSLILFLLQKKTTRRGMLHSVPASIIALELVYFLFFDLYWSDRLFISIGAFIGYMSHLIIDGFSSVDNAGKAMPPEIGTIPVIKLASKDTRPNLIAYVILFVGAYFLIADLSPNLRHISRAILAK